jgi:hypothetical protein
MIIKKGILFLIRFISRFVTPERKSMGGDTTEA